VDATAGSTPGPAPAVRCLPFAGRTAKAGASIPERETSGRQAGPPAAVLCGPPRPGEPFGGGPGRVAFRRTHLENRWCTASGPAAG
jgi:hypothetical protein